LAGVARIKPLIPGKSTRGLIFSIIYWNYLVMIAIWGYSFARNITMIGPGNHQEKLPATIWQA
jgi:hypothetical protein